jgi:hypothetical protein
VMSAGGGVGLGIDGCQPCAFGLQRAFILAQYYNAQNIKLTPTQGASCS